jgi:hypothetical protein
VGRGNGTEHGGGQPACTDGEAEIDGLELSAFSAEGREEDA